MHHADDALAVDLDPDRDRIRGIAMDEVGGPIQRIEDPADPRTAGDVSPFWESHRRDERHRWRTPVTSPLLGPLP